MNEQQKKEQLRRVPTRTLIASIKRDIRKVLRSAPAPKPKKSK
jgi:predicted component of type VI protein secretion system